MVESVKSVPESAGLTDVVINTAINPLTKKPVTTVVGNAPVLTSDVLAKVGLNVPYPVADASEATKIALAGHAAAILILVKINEKLII